MAFKIDISYKSLNKYTEELCGDKVEILKTKDSSIIILADGMGSGVKANILSTLTSKILGTMLLHGSSIDECVETLVKTLPICQVRQIAYSTFSILQIFHNGEAYLVEFDNPGCIFIRNNKIVDIPSKERVIEDQIIKEYRFKIALNDCFILMSDGAIHAGVGECLNFGWTWNHVANYALKASLICRSASRLATNIAEACNDLYIQRPGDDTTIAVTRIISSKLIHLFTGPPLLKDDDKKLIKDFMNGEGKKVVCGGTSANILARELNLPIHTTLNYSDPEIPPTALIKGIDLVTEGVLTLSRTLSLLKEYMEKGGNEKFFSEIDKDNGGSTLARLLIEECTHLHLYVGKAINTAHQNPALPFDLSIRMNLIEQLKDTLLNLGKEVSLTYY